MNVDLDPADRTFTSGRNALDDECVCPAVAAGEVGEDDSMFSADVCDVAYEYDRVVSKSEVEMQATNHGLRAYILDDEQAREAWLTALEARRQSGAADYEIEAGERVARELGWMD